MARSVVRPVRRRAERFECQHLAIRADQEGCMDKAAVEAALHRDRLVGDDQRALVAFPSGVDQRSAGSILHHELVAVHLRDATADRDDAGGRERADRDRRRGSHRHRWPSFGDDDGAGHTAQCEKARTEDGKTAAAVEAEARAGFDMVRHVLLLGVDGAGIATATAAALNRAVQTGFGLAG